MLACPHAVSGQAVFSAALAEGPACSGPMELRHGRQQSLLLPVWALEITVRPSCPALETLGRPCGYRDSDWIRSCFFNNERTSQA